MPSNDGGGKMTLFEVDKKFIVTDVGVSVRVG